MSRKTADRIASHCECGSPVRWETRETYGETRSLALCSNAGCGLISSAASQGAQPEQGLESFLLGQVPARRYLPPWMRLYWKANGWGYRFRPHHEPCTTCNGEITVQLGLPPLMERQTDFYELTMCLGCGATGIAWWLGAERTAITIDGSEWAEPSTAILILRRILEERAAMAREDRSSDFLQ
jgi:hypothetical protein